jgi:hypothetical protein
MDSSAPVLIPIQRRESSDDSGEKEWAMIEINGELLGPSSIQIDNTDAHTYQSALFDTKTRMELGSISFPENEVR